MRLNTLTAIGLLLLVTGCGSTHATKQRRLRHATTTEASTVPTAAHAPRLSSPQALVTAETENRMLVVQLPDGRIAHEVPVAPDPEDIATAGDGGFVIVVSSRAGTVTVLDRDTLHVIKAFTGFNEPHIVAISPDGKHAFITDDARGTVTVIRLSDMRIVSTIYVGLGAHHIAFSPDQLQAWIALGESAKQVVILNTTDIEHPRVIGVFDPGFLAHDLSFSPDGQRVWITSASTGDVTAFDARTHHVVFRVPVGAPPQHIAFTHTDAYLTSGYGGDIEKVSDATGRILDWSAAPYGSFELAAADGYIVASSLLRGTLAIYNSNLQRLHTVHLAPATREVAISR